MDNQEILTGNTFEKGMNLDVSDLVLQKSQARYLLNMRIVSTDEKSFVLSNIKGTEVKFQLTSGFEPVATAEFNNILYILSWNAATQALEAGSYPSPSYGTPDGNIWAYRPFNNLDDGPFRTTAFDTDTKPQIARLEIQPDYDGSVNLLFTIKGKPPRIINSKFEVISPGDGTMTLSVTQTREGTASSNDYTALSVAKETRQVIYTDNILQISLNSIPEGGGTLKPGNYRYVFYNMTEDFARSNVIGQSSVCQVAFGASDATVRGGNETQFTSRQILLNLNRIDTTFKYLKVFVVYSSGQEGVQEQYLELTQPITITGESMIFVHSGYEEMAEVTSDAVDLDLTTVEAADAGVQVGGFYMLGGITQSSFNYTAFRTAAANLAPTAAIKTITPGLLPGYADPVNVYNYMGYFGGESYPFAIVFIMPGNILSPPFPLQGKIFSTLGAGTNQANGIVTFPKTNAVAHFASGSIQVRHLRLNMSSVPADIRNQSLGFFIVRADRKPSMLTQGILIPTMKVPPAADQSNSSSENNTYWKTHSSELNDGVSFKHMPVVDSLLEAYMREMYDDNATTTGDYDKQVIDSDNRIKHGYMPVFIRDYVTVSGGVEIWYSKITDTWARHWALLSGEALLNEPEMVSILNDRTGAYIHQLSKLSFLVKGPVTPKASVGPFIASPSSTGLWYDQSGSSLYVSNTLKGIRNLNFVPGEQFSVGQFSSRLKATIYAGHHSSISGEAFEFVDMMMNAYFGVELEDEIADATKGLNNPLGGNARITAFGSPPAGSNGMSAGPNYNNLGKTVNAAFLVNIYPSATPPTAASLYPTTDNLVYRQVTPRYAWSDLPGSQTIDIFGGDCYVSKVSRRLNQSPFRDRTELVSDAFERSNIDQGIMLTWWQESRYNLHLREPKQFDDSESERRSFFPYYSQGDFSKYRANRLPETTAHSPGYARTSIPKIFIPVSSLAPSIRNDFFARIMHSERHIPNAFRNGYRSFLPGKHRDYDSSMGRITSMFNHRGNLIIVFEHGIGATSVEQRVETARDAAGQVMVEPADVLPPTLSYPSRRIGAQDHHAVGQSDSAIYGLDRSRGVIWQWRDGFKVISDEAVSSFLIKNSIISPRIGFDPQNKEVLFTTDNWTLAFREGLADHTAFYFLSFTPQLYSRRGNDLYGFLGATSHKHNADTFLIYGEQKRAFVEFVVNENVNMAKVLDYIEIISNEVPPEKVEVFTYNQNGGHTETINPAALNQYGIVPYGFDVIRDVDRIIYRNKKFKLYAPERSVYNAGSASDKWGNEGQIRDKYMIIRVTYNTLSPLELASVVTSYKIVPS